MDCLKTSNNTVARVYAAIGSGFVALGLFFCRLCASNTISINYVRGVVTVIFLAVLFKNSGTAIFLPWDRLLKVVGRSFLVGVTLLASTLAVQHIKISVFAIFSRLQLVLVYFLGIKFMGNKFDWRIVIVGLLSLLGAVLVIAPSVLGFESPHQDSLELKWTSSEILGLFMTLVWVVADAFGNIVSSKVMPLMTPAQATFYLNLILTFYCSTMASTTSTGMIFYISDIWLYVCLIVAFLAAQLFFGEAFRVEKNVTIIALISCNFLVVTMLLDVFILGTRVSAVNIVGSILVAGGSVACVLLKEKA